MRGAGLASALNDILSILALVEEEFADFLFH
jgi:hypothetical protein